MTLPQFNCPHCGSPFQVDTSFPSQQVACPHCRQPVTLLSEPPVAEPPLSVPSVMEPPVAEPPPLVPHSLSPTAPRQAEQPATITEDYLTRQLAADDRASRKFVKNMIVWVCCAIVLVSIVAYFVMKGGS